MTDGSRADGHAGLREILASCAGREVWVVGDLMLDEYVQGVVERISPEAPVPVVRASEMQYRLGGAANVARQAAVLGARVALAGVVGDDGSGRRLLEECEVAGIDRRAVLLAKHRRTRASSGYLDAASS